MGKEQLVSHMTTQPISMQTPVPRGVRYALDACALALGATRGPALIVSAMPAWEHALRARIGNRLFTIDDPARPAAQAWVGAVWIEPQRRDRRADLEAISSELPPGGVLSVVLSLPLAFLRRVSSRSALGTLPTGLWRLRGALIEQGFRVEHAFGFQTIWSSTLRWIALSMRLRPDWSDRLQHATGRIFVTHRSLLPFATTALIEARAGMRP